jgi:hypothetical protein
MPLDVQRIVVPLPYAIEFESADIEIGSTTTGTVAVYGPVPPEQVSV